MLTLDDLLNKLNITSAFKSQFNSLLKMAETPLMTIEELANYLRVQKRTIYDWLKKGKVPAIKTVGQWRFKKDKIDAWLEKGESV